MVELSIGQQRIAGSKSREESMQGDLINLNHFFFSSLPREVYRSSLTDVSERLPDLIETISIRFLARAIDLLAFYSL